MDLEYYLKYSISRNKGDFQTTEMNDVTIKDALSVIVAACTKVWLKDNTGYYIGSLRYI